MDSISLSLEARDTTQTPRQLRRSGRVPCVLYGSGIEPMTLQGEHNVLLKTYTQAGESTLVDIEANGKKMPSLIHVVDFDPVSSQIIHIDFYAVDMKKEIETPVPVHFVGESPAVEDKSAILVTINDHINVRCLPSNLPHAIEVSLEPLAEFGDQLTVADLKAPEGVTILEEEDMPLATVQEPREEEPEEPPEAEGENEGEGAEAAEGEDGEQAEEGAEDKE